MKSSSKDIINQERISSLRMRSYLLHTLSNKKFISKIQLILYKPLSKRKTTQKKSGLGKQTL